MAMGKKAAAAAAIAAGLLAGVIAVTLFSIGGKNGSASIAVPPPAQSDADPAISFPGAKLGPDDDLVLEEPFEGGPISSDAVPRRFREVRDLMGRICAQPSNKPYFDKTPCIATSISESQAGDRTRITEEEARAAERVFSQIAAVNEKTRKLMLASGRKAHINAVRESEKTIDPKVQETQEALLAGKITWGEYNQKRLAMTRKMRKPTSSRKGGK